jgi:hypothetical protein
MTRLITIADFFTAELIQFHKNDLYHYCELNYFKDKKPGDMSPVVKQTFLESHGKFREGNYHPQNLVFKHFQKLRYVFYIYFKSVLKKGLGQQLKEHTAAKAQKSEEWFKLKKIEQIIAFDELEDPLFVEMFKKLVIATNNYLKAHIKYLKKKELEDLIEDGNHLINFMEIVKQILDMSKKIPNSYFCGVLANGYSLAQNELKFDENGKAIKDHVLKSEMVVQELFSSLSYGRGNILQLENMLTGIYKLLNF